MGVERDEWGEPTSASLRSWFWSGLLFLLLVGSCVVIANTAGDDPTWEEHRWDHLPREQRERAKQKDAEDQIRAAQKCVDDPRSVLCR